MEKKYIYGGIGALALVGLGLYAYKKRSPSIAVPAGAPPPRFVPTEPTGTPAATNVFSMQGPDGQIQTASNLADLKKRLLAAFGGNEMAARMALVHLPGDTAWHPAGDTVFGPMAALAFPPPAMPTMPTMPTGTVPLTAMPPPAAIAQAVNAAMNASAANMAAPGDSGTPIKLYSQPNVAIEKVAGPMFARSAWARRRFMN